MPLSLHPPPPNRPPSQQPPHASKPLSAPHPPNPPGPPAPNTPDHSTTAQAALKSLPAMFHLILCQTADIFNTPSRISSRSIIYTHAQLSSTVPVLHDRFHFGLDMLELDILAAKAVLCRDLEALKAEREAKEREAREREAKEREAKERELQPIVIDDDEVVEVKREETEERAEEERNERENSMDFLFEESLPQTKEEKGDMDGVQPQNLGGDSEIFEDFLAGIPPIASMADMGEEGMEVKMEKKQEDLGSGTLGGVLGGTTQHSPTVDETGFDLGLSDFYFSPH